MEIGQNRESITVAVMIAKPRYRTEIEWTYFIVITNIA